ncbi:MAG TPA: hypothetical protein VE218_02995, partial [Acidobacteriaceae bacterium]|nr:hypothetical protein [Acidobacteriaceae bacterium]
MSFAIAQQEHDRKFIVNAFTIKLAAQTLTVPVGDPVVVTVTITNTYKESLYLPSEPLVWLVRLEDGKWAADTAEGLRRKEARHFPQTIVVTPLVKAGGSITTEETVSNLYEMTEPGV